MQWSGRQSHCSRIWREHMEEGRPSATAVVAAMMRAAHVLLDDKPKILRDDLALGLSGVEHETALRGTLEGLQAEIAQRTTPAFFPCKSGQFVRPTKTTTCMSGKSARKRIHKKSLLRRAIRSRGMNSPACK